MMKHFKLGWVIALYSLCFVSISSQLLAKPPKSTPTPISKNTQPNYVPASTEIQAAQIGADATWRATIFASIVSISFGILTIFLGEGKKLKEAKAAISRLEEEKIEIAERLNSLKGQLEGKIQEQYQTFQENLNTQEVRIRENHKREVYLLLHKDPTLRNDLALLESASNPITQRTPLERIDMFQYAIETRGVKLLIDLYHELGEKLEEIIHDAYKYKQGVQGNLILAPEVSERLQAYTSELAKIAQDILNNASSHVEAFPERK